MEIKITCVYDEGALENTSYIGAKGTAFIIDTEDRRVLFDTGLRHKYLLHNLEYMEIPVDSIDAVVVSQADPDNSRALNGFLTQRTEPVDVYCPAGLYSGTAGMLSRKVGLSEDNVPKARIHDITGWQEVVPGVSVSPMYSYNDGRSEAFLVLEGPAMAVVSGRGNAGPGPILRDVEDRFGRKVRAFIGSVYLEKVKKPVPEQYADQFREAGVKDIMLNHCTGRDGMTGLRVVLGLKGVSDFYVGDVYYLK